MVPALIVLSQGAKLSPTPKQSLCSTWPLFKDPTLTYFLKFIFKLVAKRMPSGSRDLARPVYHTGTSSAGHPAGGVKVNESSRCPQLGKRNHPLTWSRPGLKRLPDCNLDEWHANHQEPKNPRSHESISLSLAVHYTAHHLGLLQY